MLTVRAPRRRTARDQLVLRPKTSVNRGRWNIIKCQNWLKPRKIGASGRKVSVASKFLWRFGVPSTSEFSVQPKTSSGFASDVFGFTSTSSVDRAPQIFTKILIRSIPWFHFLNEINVTNAADLRCQCFWFVIWVGCYSFPIGSRWGKDPKLWAGNAQKSNGLEYYWGIVTKVECWKRVLSKLESMSIQDSRYPDY